MGLSGSAARTVWAAGVALGVPPAGAGRAAPAAPSAPVARPEVSAARRLSPVATCGGRTGLR